MFYFPNVLQRRTGCFSTIWLAATKGTKIVKREYLKVNVIITCQKIVQYILQQVPPPYRGSPIPRLSLYLSAQLSYGVVCVYHRQCDLLIEEVEITIERLCKAVQQGRNDLPHTGRHLLLPDNLMLMQMLEDAPNPFFGMMGISPELPEPMMIPQLSMLLENSGPDIVRLEETPPGRRRRTGHREDPTHLTSPEMITMKEVEPALLPSVELGHDLPQVSALDWELLLSEHPSLPAVETLPEPQRRHVPGELDRRKHPKDAKDAKELSPKKPKTIETMRDREIEGEQHVEDTAIEVGRKRRPLHDMEKEIERLKEEKRQIEMQRESERERERKEEVERAKKHQEKLRSETERLQKTIQDLKRLQRAGAAEKLLQKKQAEIKHLKKIQKEKERQWEAEQLELLRRMEEKERAYLKDIEKLNQRLREAEQEITAEKERAEEGMEPDEKMRKKEAHEDEKRKRETEGSPVRSSPKSGLPSEMLSELDAAALLDDVTGQPIDVFPESALAMQSPVPVLPPVSPQPLSPQLVLPEVPLEAKHVRPFRGAVRRTSLIIDKNTQIEKKVMLEQTSDPLINTQPAVPVKIPDMKSRTAASLLESPTYQSFMAPELRDLWSRCAFLEPLQYIQEQEEEFISELEEVRAGTENGVRRKLSSDVSLEASEEERSQPVLLTPEERRSLFGQEDRFLPMVSEMPEMIVELPETEEVLLSDLQRKLFSEIDSAGHSEFLSLAPHSLSRLLVSRFFYSCLVLCTQEIIHLEQTEPYGPIIITPGRLYSQSCRF
ncbi:meiotic recombination protein REC8 homolog [Phyllobates terribilis]|uniref:meiotic recombination protein REC8 homolog n=1 Tax=Phyllobates terribilis TaxID=111132 RepID=UPI003CCB4DF7